MVDASTWISDGYHTGYASTFTLRGWGWCLVIRGVTGGGGRGRRQPLADVTISLGVWRHAGVPDPNTIKKTTKFALFRAKRSIEMTTAVDHSATVGATRLKKLRGFS